MAESMIFVLSCLYFFLPAYFANMAAPMVARTGYFKLLAVPIDGGKKFKGEPILGDHKTWRGALFAMLAGIIVFYIQRQLFTTAFFNGISLIEYGDARIGPVGFFMPLASVLGDLFAAFAKRRLKLKPGAKFMPWDQTNYVLGNFALLGPILRLDLMVWAVLLFYTFFIHIIVNRIGFELGLHKAKW
jgi:CDP-2,3-bis-(O-geranylgeranyl)-sn-glycerol synthase